MLKIMENEVEIFRAWLKKYIKQDKKMKGAELASKVGLRPPQISHYHSGRVDNGVRSFPHIPFEMRQSILEATGTSYDQMLEAGRKELSAQSAPPEDWEDTIKSTVRAELEANLPSFSIQAQSKEPENDIQRYKSLKNAKHHEIVDKFRHSNLAEKINHLLLELDQKGGERWLKRVERYVKAELEDLSEEEEESKTGSRDDPSGERKGA